MMNSTRVGLLLSLVCLLSSSGAGATCAPGIQTARARLAAHDAVFVGRVVEVRKAKISAPSQKAAQEPVFPNEVVFQVSVAWKGVHDSRLVAIDDLIFEAGVGVGREYLVFAMRQSSDARLLIRGCGDTKRYEQAAEEIHELGKPEYVTRRQGTS